MAQVHHEGTPVWVVRFGIPPESWHRRARVMAKTADRARLHILQEYPRARVERVAPEME